MTPGHRANGLHSHIQITVRVIARSLVFAAPRNRAPAHRSIRRNITTTRLLVHLSTLARRPRRETVLDASTRAPTAPSIPLDFLGAHDRRRKFTNLSRTRKTFQPRPSLRPAAGGPVPALPTSLVIDVKVRRVSAKILWASPRHRRAPGSRPVRGDRDHQLRRFHASASSRVCRRIDASEHTYP